MRRLQDVSRPERRRLSLLVAATILVGSLIPDPSVALAAVGLQQVSVPALLQTSSPATGAPFGLDKVVHALSYAVLAGLLGSTWERRPRLVGVLVVVAVASLFGAGIEVAQAFVPGRTASGGDLVANTVGAALGVVVAVGLFGWWRDGPDEGSTAVSR